MATDPRENFDQTFSDVAADFEDLAALLQAAVEDLKSWPDPDTHAFFSLRRAQQAALRGKQRAEAAAEQRARDDEA